MFASVHQLYSADLPSDKPILIPDGEYSVMYSKHATWLFMGKHPKVIITFLIQDFGEFHLQPICAYYNAHRLKGKPSKNGHFTVGWKSDLMLDYSTLFGTPPRKDRIPMCRFKNKFVKIQTRTVTKNRNQRKYPEGMQYSVIDRMQEVTEI